MSDLRAKLTLTLDDQLSRAAKAALGSLKVGSEAAVKGVHGLGVELDKLSASGRDNKGRFLPKGIGEEAEKAKAPVYGLGGALDGLMKRKSDPGAVLKGAGSEAFKAAPKVRKLSDAFDAFNRKVEAGHKRLFALREAAGAMDDAAGTIGGASDKIIGGLGGAAKSSIDFNKQFVDIGVKANLSGADLETLRQNAMALGEEFGTMPGEVAKGIDVLSAAGWGGDKLKGDGLRDMMMAAKLGFSDFNTTAAVGTGILAVYAGSADENRTTMLQLANAVNASKISMEDLNYGLQDNMVIAKQAKMSITDLLAVEALLGMKNIKGGVANTATKNLAMLLGNPGAEAQKELTKLFGSKSKAKLALFDEKGVRRQVPEVLATIRKQLDAGGGRWAEGTQKRENLMQALFGKDAAGNASDIMNALTEVGATGQSVYAEMKAKIEDTTATQKSFNTLQGSTAAQLAKAGASWENLKITLGDQFLPAAIEVAKELGGILRTVKEWATEHPTLTKVLLYSTLFVGAFGKAIGGTLSLVSSGIKLYTSYTTATAAAGLAGKATALSIGGIGTALKGVGIALMTTPLGAMMLFAGATYLAIQNMDKLKRIADEVMPKAVTSLVGGAVDIIAQKQHETNYRLDTLGVAKDLREGKLTASQAQMRFASAKQVYDAGPQVQAPTTTGAGANDEMYAMTQELQANMQQLNLPPEALGKRGDNVTVTVKDERTIVKKGGAEVPFGQRVPT